LTLSLLNTAAYPPAATALLEIGSKDGAVKVVNDNGKAMVYSWKAATMEWEVRPRV
jgi:hypothetical protein